MFVCSLICLLVSGGSEEVVHSLPFNCQLHSQPGNDHLTLQLCEDLGMKAPCYETLKVALKIKL